MVWYVVVLDGSSKLLRMELEQKWRIVLYNNKSNIIFVTKFCQLCVSIAALKIMLVVI